MSSSFSSRTAPRLASAFVVWGCILALCTLLSLAVAQVNWTVMALILGGVAAVSLLLVEVEAIFLVWLFGIPTVFGLANNYLNVIPSVTVDRLLFLVLFVLIVAPPVLRRTPALPMLDVEKLIALFLGYCVVSLFVWSGDKKIADLRVDGAMFFSGYLMPLGSLLLARRMRWTEARIHWALVLLVLAGFTLAVIAALQIVAGVTFFNPDYLDLERSGIAQERATGTFASAGEFGAVMASLLVLVLPLFRRLQDGFARVAVATCAVCILAGLILGKTRGPFVCFIVSVIVLFLLDRTLRPIIVAGVLASGVATLLALPFLLDSNLLRDRLTEISPIYNRLSLWASGVNMAINNPIFGMGFGRYSFLRALPDYITGVGDVSAEWATTAAVPHNEYIHVAILLGLPGLLIFVAILWRGVAALRDAVERAPAGSARRDAALCAIAILFGYIVNGLVIDYGLYRFFGVVVFGLVGIALSPPVAAHDASGRRA